jgi:hypothetical protein
MSYNATCSVRNILDEPAFTLPFFPAPAGAAESCSCDLNKLNDNLPEDDGHLACMEKVRKERGDDDDEEKPTPDCDCCIYGAYAAA